MPGSKGESGMKPGASRSPALDKSANRMGDAVTDNIQGWNSGDGSQARRGGEITNSNGQYGNPKKRGGGGGGGSNY